MKHNLIKTDDYLLVGDDSEIKGYYYDYFINKVKHSGGAEYGDTLITKNIAAHLPLNGAPVLEDVPLLPPFEDDVEKLAKLKYPIIMSPNGRNLAGGHYDIDVNFSERSAYERGYKKAREKYKYTEEDARYLIMYSFLLGVDRGHYSKEIEDRIIQSTNQPKLPVAFECEMKQRFEGDKSKRENPYNGVYYTPKTITNSEGRTEWVGKYIY